jgi:1,6-anhydro-N-acetylmuramate kinase
VTKTVREPLTPKPTTFKTEAPQYGAFVRRSIRAMGARIAQGDIEGLAELAGLREHLDDTIAVTVQRLRLEQGYSWSDIGRVLGTSRQSAQERYGDRHA